MSASPDKDGQYAVCSAKRCTDVRGFAGAWGGSAAAPGNLVQIAYTAMGIHSFNLTGSNAVAIAAAFSAALISVDSNVAVEWKLSKADLDAMLSPEHVFVTALMDGPAPSSSRLRALQATPESGAASSAVTPSVVPSIVAAPGTLVLVFGIAVPASSSASALAAVTSVANNVDGATLFGLLKGAYFPGTGPWKSSGVSMGDLSSASANSLPSQVAVGGATTSAAASGSVAAVAILLLLLIPAAWYLYTRKSSSSSGLLKSDKVASPTKVALPPAVSPRSSKNPLTAGAGNRGSSSMAGVVDRTVAKEVSPAASTVGKVGSVPTPEAARATRVPTALASETREDAAAARAKLRAMHKKTAYDTVPAPLAPSAPAEAASAAVVVAAASASSTTATPAVSAPLPPGWEVDAATGKRRKLADGWLRFSDESDVWYVKDGGEPSWTPVWA